MRARSSRGQAAVELALVVPLVAALFLALVQVALIVRDQVLVVHAAREAARAAAVDPSPEAPRRAALAGAPLEPARLELQATRDRTAGEVVDVTISYRSPTRVPLIGPFVPDVALRGRASMRVEGTGAPRSASAQLPSGTASSPEGPPVSPGVQVGRPGPP